MVSLCTRLTKAQAEEVVSGKIKLEVTRKGFYMASAGSKIGLGRSPRQAIEALKVKGRGTK